MVGGGGRRKKKIPSKAEEGKKGGDVEAKGILTRLEADWQGAIGGGEEKQGLPARQRTDAARAVVKKEARQPGRGTKEQAEKRVLLRTGDEKKSPSGRVFSKSQLCKLLTDARLAPPHPPQKNLSKRGERGVEDFRRETSGLRAT